MTNFDQLNSVPIHMIYLQVMIVSFLLIMFIVKSPILTNFDEETINFISVNEKQLIRGGRLQPEHFGVSHNFSRKVFVGGLPRNITEESVIRIFSNFGSLNVDWPYKENSANAFVPPKGFVFLLYKDNVSVDHLLDNCQRKGNEYFMSIPRNRNDNDKKMVLVQIRPWKLFGGVDHFFVPLSQMDVRLTIFVGGVPRTLNATEIGMIMAKLFGKVAYVGIDLDPVYSYPKGSARVIFLNKSSLISAVKKRFIMPAETDDASNRMMEIKPYVLDNQTCDRCQTDVDLDDEIPATTTFLCPEPQCLLYLCEFCWVEVHSQQNLSAAIHKPIVKQGTDDYTNSLKKRGFGEYSAKTILKPIVKQGKDDDENSLEIYGLEESSMTILNARANRPTSEQ